MNWKIYGVENYLTKSPGIGGKIKVRIEDFVVEEVPIEIQKDNDGKYVYAKIKLVNWETNRFVAKLAKYLGISRKRITFAGNKDKRGITTQYFCINHPNKELCEEKLKKIKMKGVEVLETFRSNFMLEIGMLKGNRFNVRVRDANIENMDVVDEIESYGIFPNFFGPQRFGEDEPYTHIVGKYILEKRYKDAVEYYFSKYSVEEVLRGEHRDYEKIMAMHLKENPQDYIGALKKLPRNLLTLFVHAYQSYIFNKIVSKRLDIEEPHIPKIGDVVFIAEEIPNFKREIRVNEFNLEKMKKLALERRVFVTAPLFGYSTKLSSGIQGDIEREILEEEGITREIFVNKDIPEISSAGRRRPIFIPFENLEYKIDKKDVIFKFFLYKGCYATSFLREIMKS